MTSISHLSVETPLKGLRMLDKVKKGWKKSFGGFVGMPQLNWCLCAMYETEHYVNSCNGASVPFLGSSKQQTKSDISYLRSQEKWTCFLEVS